MDQSDKNDSASPQVTTSKPKFDKVDKWGYAICFGTIITFIASIGHVNSFGLIYNDFMLETHASAKSLTSAHGVFALMLAVGGIILNLLTKKITLRTGGLIGSIIFVAGSVATIPISTTNQLPLTFGVLQGIGFGMMVPVSYSTLNYYFVKKRTAVMSLCKAVQGIVLMFYPQMLKHMMSYYGLRGTLLLLSGISLHTVPGMLVMRTAEQQKTASTAYEVVGLEILEILNVRVLRDVVFCNICVGLSFVNFSDLTFFILQPMLLFQYGYNKGEVAWCISICAGADVCGRCALAVVSSLVPTNTRLLYYVSSFCTLVLRIALLQARSFPYVSCLTGALGVLRAWLHVTSPLVVASQVKSQEFPGAYAVYMLAAGLVNVAGSPVIGLLKDLNGDYVPAFYGLALCCLPCLLLWPLEYFLKNK
ncbi:unnamed protein product [Plutella xylostella]|uniref:(diamondback moth) hypothetical protein n=1 Tax=Plutella xylostella TaxID=51655 RepID=A0A8S4G5H9_PLUXY|nr:unnamed protein product [Plutella xylostella]